MRETSHLLRVCHTFARYSPFTTTRDGRREQLQFNKDSRLIHNTRRVFLNGASISTDIHSSYLRICAYGTWILALFGDVIDYRKPSHKQ